MEDIGETNIVRDVAMKKQKLRILQKKLGLIKNGKKPNKK